MGVRGLAPGISSETPRLVSRVAEGPKRYRGVFPKENTTKPPSDIQMVSSSEIGSIARRSATLRSAPGGRRSRLLLAALALSPERK